MINLVPYNESRTVDYVISFFGFHQSINGQANSPKLTQAKENIEIWTSEKHELYIIESDNAPVGFVHIWYKGGNVAWIEDVFVDEKHRGQGIGSQAINLAEEIIKQKKDWFLYYELSQITQKLNKIEDALRYAAIAAYSLGDIEMKIHLWEYLYQLLLQTKNFPQAVKILSLSAAVRAQKGWKISPSLKQEIDKHNLQPENLPSYKNIFTELKPWFIEMSYSGSEVLTGYISNILASNKAGFITTGKKYYYFKTSSCLFEPEYIVPNTKVSFNTEKSFDPKKQKDSIIAVNIKRI